MANPNIDEIETIGEELMERNPKHVCPLCEKQFANAGLYASHMKRVHPDFVGFTLTEESVEVPTVEDVPTSDEVHVEESVSRVAGRIDRGEWYNERTAIQVFLLNTSEELAFIDEQVKSTGAKGRTEILMKALRAYMNSA